MLNSICNRFIIERAKGKNNSVTIRVKKFYKNYIGVGKYNIKSKLIGAHYPLVIIYFNIIFI